VIKYGGHADQQSRKFPAMDQFRIKALDKILRSGVLTPEQAQAASHMLETKARIYLGGALKRGRQEEAAKIREILSRLFPPHPDFVSTSPVGRG